MTAPESQHPEQDSSNAQSVPESLRLVLADTLLDGCFGNGLMSPLLLDAEAGRSPGPEGSKEDTTGVQPWRVLSHRTLRMAARLLCWCAESPVVQQHMLYHNKVLPLLLMLQTTLVPGTPRVACPVS